MPARLRKHGNLTSNATPLPGVMLPGVRDSLTGVSGAAQVLDLETYQG